MHRGRRDIDPERRQVARQEQFDKPPPPLEALLVAAREKGRRRAAPDPQRACPFDADLLQVEAADLDDGQPSQQRFPGLLQQRHRGAAEQQELRCAAFAVHQHAQLPKQPGRVLHLVDDDQPGQSRQQFLGRPELRRDRGIFKVEVIGGVRRDEGAGKRRLADLARPDQQHAAKPLGQARHLVTQAMALDQQGHAPMPP
jgi:hypothetical protein